MKVLLVGPGASYSVSDVWSGVSYGLKALGHHVYDYALDGRISAAGQYLDFIWRKSKKTAPRATPSDILYKAGEEVVTRALRVEPDLVLVISAMFLHPDIPVLLKRAGLKVGVLFTESPYDDERQVRLLEFVDFAWTNERTSAREMGIPYLRHAWHPDVHTVSASDETTVAAHDVVFVGTGFQERIDLLASVDWTGIDLGLYGSWDLLGSRHRLREHIKGAYIENSTAAALYHRAKIGLNLYRTSKGFGKGAPHITAAESLNPRAYELAAMGCFTISDYREEVAEVFGDLVPTFTDGVSLRTLIDQYLTDDLARERIRAQLPAAVAGETWTERVRGMMAQVTRAGIVARGDSPTGERITALAGG